jgi:hypothetical protein
MLLHIKYLYGIRVEVRGAHHFPPSQPYVVVSNHQSSLDLLGETLPNGTHSLAMPSLVAPSPEPAHLEVVNSLACFAPSLPPQAFFPWGRSALISRIHRPLVTRAFTWYSFNPSP